MIDPNRLRLRFADEPNPAGLPPADPPAPPADPDPANPAPPADDEQPTPGEEQLGDAGKKALDAMKARMKAEREARIKAEQERDAERAKAEGRETEHQKLLEQEQVKKDALAAANQRILKAEIRTAAASKLADPQDALRLLDVEDDWINDDGDVDSAAINAAIDDLIKTKPYLAAQGGGRFQGSGDGGARNGANTTSQLTEADLESMSPAEINEARRAGRLNKILGK